MSSPAPAPPPGEPITVEPAALEALAAELDGLAADLIGDAEQSRSLAATFPVALGGDDGWAASATATAWASLEELLADRARALAGTLAGAATAYRAHEAALSGHMGRGLPPGDRMPR
jgi:hypothetical protein